MSENEEAHVLWIPMPRYLSGWDSGGRIEATLPTFRFDPFDGDRLYASGWRAKTSLRVNPEQGYVFMIQSEGLTRIPNLSKIDAETENEGWGDREMGRTKQMERLRDRVIG